jgi:hypothetical protein
MMQEELIITATEFDNFILMADELSRILYVMIRNLS